MKSSNKIFSGVRSIGLRRTRSASELQALGWNFKSILFPALAIISACCLLAAVTEFVL